MSVERIATSLRTAGQPAGRGTATVPEPLARLWHKAAAAIERRRALSLIGEMDDRMLRDIGIVRSDAERAIRYGREDERPVPPWWGR